jgi:hypothetical protein
MVLPIPSAPMMSAREMSKWISCNNRSFIILTAYKTTNTPEGALEQGKKLGG